MPPNSSILLLVVFYLLLLVEFFIPSAGVIGVAAAIAAVSAIVTAFLHSPSAGLTMFALIVATTPLILVSMIHVWPRTAIGRRILNRRPGQVAESTASQRTLPDGRMLSELDHRIGFAITDLLPAGLVQIDGHRMDAVSMGVPIDAGSRVIVTKIQAGKIQVRPALDHEQEDSDSSPEELVPRSPDMLDTDLSELEADDLSTS